MLLYWKPLFGGRVHYGGYPLSETKFILESSSYRSMNRSNKPEILKSLWWIILFSSERQSARTLVTFDEVGSARAGFRQFRFINNIRYRLIATTSLAASNASNCRDDESRYYVDKDECLENILIKGRCWCEASKWIEGRVFFLSLKSPEMIFGKSDTPQSLNASRKMQFWEHVFLVFTFLAFMLL